MPGILTQELSNTGPSISDRAVTICFYVFAAILAGAAFLFNTPAEILRGYIVILTSSANLVTDYFEIANTGAALVNAAIMVLQAVVMIGRCRIRLSGPLAAAIFTVAGFSLFGKNPYNSAPIMLGVFAYARLCKIPFSELIPTALFGTALAPLVSEVSFNFGLLPYHSLLLGILAGFVTGFFMRVLALHFINFHKGFNLYNIGFTAGIIGTLWTAILRCFGVAVDSVYLVSQGNNLPLSILLFAMFAAMLTTGLAINRWSLRGFKALIKETGRGGGDFFESHGHGPVFINMALLGIVSTLYILAVGGELNGPTIGGVFTVVGFGASGKHLRNVLPILAGVFAVSCCSVHDVNSTAALLAALFGTTLAPVSGSFGIVAGFVAGGLHMILTTNISFLHAGMNLYNNGFSGGFIAAVTLPVLEKIREIRNRTEACGCGD